MISKQATLLVLVSLQLMTTALATPVVVTLTSDSEAELVAVSATGKATCTGNPCVAVSGTNDATATNGAGGPLGALGLVAASGTGLARGGVPLSGANRCGKWYEDTEKPCFAVDTSGGYTRGYWLAVSKDGEADDSWVSVSGTGDAHGNVALSGTGSVRGDIIGATGTGSATRGDYVAASGTGPATGQTLVVSGTGSATCAAGYDCVPISVADALCPDGGPICIKP